MILRYIVGLFEYISKNDIGDIDDIFDRVDIVYIVTSWYSNIVDIVT